MARALLGLGTSAAISAAVDTSHRKWVETGARFGHLTKGIIYGLIGALALQVALDLDPQVSILCAVLFIGVALVFVWRSFYKMRIQSEPEAATGTGSEAAASPH